MLTFNKNMYEPLLPGAPADMDKHHKKELRLGFIKKVLGIVTAQLIFTTFVGFVINSSESTTQYLRDNIWVTIVSLVAYIIVAIIIMCCRKTARAVPTNYILLGILTFALSILVGFITTYYTAKSVLQVLLLTILISGSLTAYALTCKIKMKKLVGIMVIVLVGLLSSVVMMLVTGYQGYYTLFCLFGVILYGIFLLYDVKMLAKKDGISHEDYILGAMIIYLDIINLFLQLLRLFGDRK